MNWLGIVREQLKAALERGDQASVAIWQELYLDECRELGRLVRALAPA